MIYDYEELSFQILGILKVDHPKGFFEVRGRPYAALSCRVSGTCKFNFEGKKVESNSGDILFIPQNVSYDVDYSGGTMIVVHFYDCNYHTPENIALNNAAYVTEKFWEMLKEWEQRRSIFKIKSAIYNILQICRDTNSISRKSTLAEKAKTLIDTNYENPSFNITSLSEMLYVSPSTLRKNFASRFDMSPKQYLLKIRIDTAISLLSEGFLPVREISKKCGFEDEHYFSRIVKKKHGLPPSKI